MDEVFKKFFCLELAVLDYSHPRQVLILTRVCRRWNSRFKGDQYWYKYRNNVLRRLPVLKPVFDELKHMPLWMIFTRHLWGVASAVVISNATKRAIVVAGHGFPERIATIATGGSEFARITYTDSSSVVVHLREHEVGAPNDLPAMLRRLANANGKKQKMTMLGCNATQHHYSDGFINGGFRDYCSVVPASVLFGPFLDIVMCRPKGRRFRNRIGTVDGKHVRSNFLFFEK